MRDRVHHLLLNERVFQQMQPPAFVAVGRGAAHKRNQVGFALAIKKTLFALLLHFAAQAGFQSAFGRTAYGHD